MALATPRTMGRVSICSLISGSFTTGVVVTRRSTISRRSSFCSTGLWLRLCGIWRLETIPLLDEKPKEAHMPDRKADQATASEVPFSLNDGHQPLVSTSAPSAPRIRVLFVAHDSGMFGAQRSLLTLLQGLDKDRIESRVVVPYPGEFSAEVDRLGIPIDQRYMVRWVPEAAVMAKEGRWRCLQRGLHGLRERAWAIARIIERHQIDVVYTNTAVCVEGAIAARMARVPHVWHVLEPISRNPELGAVAPKFLYMLAIRMLSRRVVFCSKSLAAEYSWIRSNSSIVYNGLRLPSAFDRTRSRAILAEKLGISDTTKIVAIVGAIQPRKDHSTFLAAAERIVAEHSDVAFLIVGSGKRELVDALNTAVKRRHLSEQTHVVGWWKGPIHDVLAAVDVLVVSSIQESFGLTIIESMSVETPVVATRCGGPEEVLRDGVDGRLVPVGGAREMANGILDLLRDPATAQAYGRAGRLAVTARFSVERFVQNLQDVIEQAAARAT